MKAFVFLVGLMSAGWAFAGTKAFDSGMEPILQNYLKIQNALASDNMAGVKKAAARIKAEAAKLDPKSVTGEHAAHYKNVPAHLLKNAAVMSKVSDLKSARDSFKRLSQPMAMWVGMSKPKGVNVFYCSMAKASWVQKSESVKNPYYGQKMLKCGEVVK